MKKEDLKYGNVVELEEFDEKNNRFNRIDS